MLRGTCLLLSGFALGVVFGGDLAEEFDGRFGGFEFGLFDGGAAEAVAYGEIRAVVVEVLDDFEGSEPCGGMDGVDAEAGGALFVDVGAEFDHELHGFQFAAAGGEEEATGAIGGFGFRVGAELDELLHHFQVAGFGCR